MSTLRRNYDQAGLFIFAIFFAGIILGSLFSNTLDPTIDPKVADVSSLVSGFIDNTNHNGLSNSYLLGSSFMTYGKQVVLIWGFGILPITIPLISLLVGVQGFSYGFTTSFFVMEYNLKGLLLGLGAYGVQGTLFVFIMILLAIEATRYGRKNRPVSAKIYFVYLLVSVIGVGVISLYETYIAPRVIQEIITRFF